MVPMLLRLVLLAFLLASCAGVNEMGCPKVRVVKLNRKPANYMRSHYRSLSASTRENTRDDARVNLKPKRVKTIESIEEWDCPKPGSRAPIPKPIKENIRKNKKKFDSYYKNRMEMDSVGVGTSH